MLTAILILAAWFSASILAAAIITAPMRKAARPDRPLLRIVGGTDYEASHHAADGGRDMARSIHFGTEL